MRFIYYSDALCIQIDNFRSKGQPKISFFFTFCEFQIQTYFTIVFDAMIIILDFTFNNRSTVVKKVFLKCLKSLLAKTDNLFIEVGCFKF